MDKTVKRRAVNKLGTAMKLSFAVGLAVMQVNEVYADSTGRAGRSGVPGGSTCATAGCHSVGAALPTVTFTGPTSVVAGATNTYTFTITGGPGSTTAGGNAGVGISATAGMLAATMAGTKILSNEVVQDPATPFPMGGTVTYTFDWMAPTTVGTATLYGAGLSGDGPGTRGGDGTAIKMLAVTVTAAGGANQAPVALITGPTTGTAGTAVTFSGAGSTDADGTIATYAWNFGDGTAGAGVSAPHTYVAGTYTVTLTVTDNMGATHSATSSIVIAPIGTQLPPTADAGGPYMGTVGTPVMFNGSKSADADGTIASYSWDFGHANAMGTGVSPSHTYTMAGTYMIALTVTDNSGATATAQTTAVITAATPPPPPPPATTGEQLYNDNCAGCHGVGGVGIPKNGPDIRGESAEDIWEAFEEYPTDHAGLAALGQEKISAIADFLKMMPNLTPALGEQLFNENCASCHGAGGVGIPGNGPNIIGESVGDIWEAFKEYPADHVGLAALGQEKISAIADFLKMMPNLTPVLGEQLFNENCASCHGAGGVGIRGNGPNIIGESAEDIWEAFQEYPRVHAGLAALGQENINAIANFLDTMSSPGSNPIVGEKLFNDNCADCHGVGGVGIPGNGPNIVGESVGDFMEAFQEYPTEHAGLDTLDLGAIAAYLDPEAKGASAQSLTGVGTGALDWLTLFGAGAWLARRRRVS